MARKIIIDLDCDSTVEWTAKGQVAEGYYLGFKNINTDYGAAKLHIFKGEKGNFGIYGAKQLDEKLGTVTIGNYTDVTFEGKVKLPGGKTMKKFVVGQDDENTIEVSGTPQGNTLQRSTEPEYENEDGLSADDIDDVDDETLDATDEDDAPPQRSAPTQRPMGRAATATPAKAPVAASSASRASVESLLATRKR